MTDHDPRNCWQQTQPTEELPILPPRGYESVGTKWRVRATGSVSDMFRRLTVTQASPGNIREQHADTHAAHYTADDLIILWELQTRSLPDFNDQVDFLYSLVGRANSASLATFVPSLDEPLRTKIASRKDTEPFLWHALINDSEVHIRRLLAFNRNMPHDVLALLADDTDSETRLAVASHLHTSPDTLTALASDIFSNVRASVAHHTNAPQEAIQLLVGDPDPQVRSSVATRRGLPESVVGLLSVDPDDSVRTSLAGNRSVASAVLTTLAEDPVALVRQAIAGNRSTPARLVEKLQRDPDAEVRIAAHKQLGLD